MYVYQGTQRSRTVRSKLRNELKAHDHTASTKFVPEVVARAERFQIESRLLGPHDIAQEDLVRLILQLPPADLTLLGQRLSQTMNWLLLYHSDTPEGMLPWALAGMRHQNIAFRQKIRARIGPQALVHVNSFIRPLVTGRLLLAVLNGHLPLTALPAEPELHAYLDE